ncbi:hypothetical protein GYMLUDRAFT_81322 [Collybiopsis luxurians FD-317 M1]|nr:hypothetical protein GYMLUDRAFT_81322 [Collybiopsis luxurians FD-317 M1]
MTAVLRLSASSSSLTSLVSSAFVPLFNSLATQIVSNDEQMNTDDESISQPESHPSTSESPAGPSTGNPLKEEPTEPYFPDDSKSTPQPSPEELAGYGIKVRDFAYESKLPPLKPYVRPAPDPNRIQAQPDPRTWSRFLGGNASGSGSAAGRALERLITDGLVRQRGFNGLDDLEESQQSNFSSPAHSQSQPPLEYITSQDSDEIETPFVTPNGSLQWTITSHIPIDELDNPARIPAAEFLEAKSPLRRTLPSVSDFLDSPKPSAAELTLPNLSSPTAPTQTHLATRPGKRKRTTPPESPSPPKRITPTPSPSSKSSPGPTSDTSCLPSNVTPPSSHPPRYHLRARRPANELPALPRGASQKPVRSRRSSFSIQSSQSKAPTKQKGSRNGGVRSGATKDVSKAKASRKVKGYRE